MISPSLAMTGPLTAIRRPIGQRAPWPGAVSTRQGKDGSSSRVRGIPKVTRNDGAAVGEGAVPGRAPRHHAAVEGVGEITRWVGAGAMRFAQAHGCRK
jgi:hypothetical protein